MIASVAPYIGVVALIAGLIWYLRRDNQKIGAAGVTEDALKKEVEDEQKAKVISDRIDNMPAADFDGLREKLNHRQ